MGGLSVLSLDGLPEVGQGDDLARLIVGAAGTIDDGTIVAIAQKIVSKAEGALVHLADVTPSARALALAVQQGKDPRVAQVVLDQSARVIRAERGVIICETHHGFVCANAGVDASNAAERDTLILLPRDPDESARQIRADLKALTGKDLGVLITDSFGRAWRNGQLDVAIGCAGITPLDDWRERVDSFGRELHATWLATADAIAAAAELARAKDSREPVILINGLEWLMTSEDGPGAGALARAASEDLFR